MSSSERPSVGGQRLDAAELHQRRQRSESRRALAVVRVNQLLETQRVMGRELAAGLEELEQHGAGLAQIERDASEVSILAALVRPFTRGRTVLARRSIAEGLLRQYERVSERLRDAHTFADELRLAALELQHEVDTLHQELGRALQRQRQAAQRILEREAALEELANLELAPEARARRQDRFAFDLRTESASLMLHKAAAEQCRHHLEPARSLRDTVLLLHEEMAQYVLSATHTVNAAGRRIQGLGMLADAPIVVAELQGSIDDLSRAMEATSRYVDQSERLIGEVLPSLSATLDARANMDARTLTARLGDMDRDMARREAEAALRDAAEDEIEQYLKGAR